MQAEVAEGVSRSMAALQKKTDSIVGAVAELHLLSKQQRAMEEAQRVGGEGGGNGGEGRGGEGGGGGGDGGGGATVVEYQWFARRGGGARAARSR